MQRKKKRHLDPRVWPSDCMQERAPTPGGKPSIIAGADERRAGWTGHGTLLGVTLRDRLPPACRWRAAPSYHDDVKKQVLCCIGAEGHSRRPPTRVPGASAAGRGGGRTPAKTHAAGVELHHSGLMCVPWSPTTSSTVLQGSTQPGFPCTFTSSQSLSSLCLQYAAIHRPGTCLAVSESPSRGHPHPQH